MAGTVTDGGWRKGRSLAVRKSGLWIQHRPDPRGYHPFEVARRKAVILSLMGRWDEADALLQRNLELAPAGGLSWHQARSLIDIGGLMFKRGDYPQALDLCRRALDLSQELDDPGLIGDSLNNLGNACYNLGDYEQAEQCFGRRLALAEEQGYLQGLGEALNNLGTLYADRGKYREAMECYRRKLEIASQLGDKQGEGLAWGNVAMVHYYLGEFAQVEENLQKQMALARSIGDLQMMALASGNLGILYMDLGDYGQSLEFSRRKLAICQTLGAKAGVNEALSNIGTVHYHLGEYGEALEYLEKERNYNLGLGDRLGVALSNLTIGNIHKERDQIDLAARLYREALAVLEELGVKHYCSELLLNQAELSLLGDDCPGAERLAAKSLEYAREVGRKDVAFQAQVMLAGLTAGRDLRSGRKQLNALLAGAGSDEERALANFALFRATADPAGRDRALGLYRELYRKTNRKYYRDQIDKLNEGER